VTRGVDDLLADLADEATDNSREARM